MADKLTEHFLMIGIPEAQADLLYATRFLAPDEVVYFQKGGVRYLVTSPMELHRAREEAVDMEVISSSELFLSKETSASPTAWAGALLRRERVKRCAVPGWFPVAAARALEQMGIHITVDDRFLAERRAVKSAEEIDSVRQVQRAAAAAIRAAATFIGGASVCRNGVLRLDGRTLTSESVRTLIETVLLKHGCSTPGGTIVSCGAASSDPHQQGSGPLCAHQPIVLDIFPRSKRTGYWGDITRTLVKGDVPSKIKVMHAAVCAARRAALSMVAPGVEGRCIHERVHEVFEAHGFETSLTTGTPSGFIHSTGHGVGLDVHEPPRLSRTGGVLKAGHVITIEPGLYYPDTGGVRVEDTIEVTENGWKYLATTQIGLTP